MSPKTFDILITVDLTTGDPWTGTFIAPESGWWRFTFTAQIFDRDFGPIGGKLYIDGKIVASYFSDSEVEITFITTMNTIQHVTAGQNITITWYGDDEGNRYIMSATENKSSHFTGEYLGNTGPTPPECEFPGQTFQYPGSCRQYWLCQTDGTVDIMDCCPDVYLPDADACVSEDLVIVDSICHSEDICA